MLAWAVFVNTFLLHQTEILFRPKNNSLHMSVKIIGKGAIKYVDIRIKYINVAVCLVTSLRGGGGGSCYWEGR